MEFTPPEVQLAGIAPELALVVAAFVVVITDAVVGGRSSFSLPVLSSLGLVAAIAFAVLGAICLLVADLSTYADRALFDSKSFADRATSTLDDQDVRG